jgi:hypothetical protein
MDILPFSPPKVTKPIGRNTLPPLSGFKNKPGKKPSSSRQQALKMEWPCSSEMSVDVGGLHGLMFQNIEFFVMTVPSFSKCM